MSASAVVTPTPASSGAVILETTHVERTQGLNESEECTSGRYIKLPEALFSSIMSIDPEINPLYKTSKALSDDWLRK